MQIASSSNSNETCAEVVAYTGQACRRYLTSLQACFSGVSSPPPALNIPSAVNQQQGETAATQLLNGLEFFLSPTPQCSEEIRPFLCLHIFSLCDSSGHLHTTLRQDCIRLRDDVCSDEWTTAMSLLPAGTLPVCEDLPDTIEECTGAYFTL